MIWRRYIALVILICLVACKNKNDKPLADNEVVDKKDFFSSIKKLPLPATLADTTSGKDSTTISLGVVKSFLPDSILSKYVSDTAKLRISPIGKIDKDNNLYVLLRFMQKAKTTTGVFVFKNKKYVSNQELLLQGKDGYNTSISINKEPTFIVSSNKTTETTYLYSLTGYAFNEEAKSFLVIISDSNEPSETGVVINPIDTLPAKNKLSGDYYVNDKNFISIRDGKSENDYVFFIYFEKNKGECNAELKANLAFVEKDKYIFTKPGDPCVIEFLFGTNMVKVKEQGSCGNHRGIKCYFDDTYRKKKATLKTTVKKK